MLQLWRYKMIPQNKGKDLHKIPASKLPQGLIYVSKKFDGHYVQIKKYKGLLSMTTSGGKEFYLAGLADYINIHFTEDFHIECEFNYACEGKLGDRGKSAILTTYRTNFIHGRLSQGEAGKDIFRVLDLLGTDLPFRKRLYMIQEMFLNHPWFTYVVQHLVTVETAQALAKQWKAEGYEGAMGKTPAHIYQPGKRSNTIIKFKPRLSADLLCVGIKEGTGKYEGMIGSLLLQSANGTRVWAGSGLSDTDRQRDDYIGKVIEIEYERIDDTYIQPIIKWERVDKTEEEID